ncbi:MULTISPECIES: hypothetical protein [Mycobacteriaceae]|uniref:hypothetical protein n=1 Tax=Mycobacteriaceae TaxID=1762 RepID=UPI0012E7226D|nr:MULTISPECIES: hypothetical protein [Mycobacteriaceae]MCK0176705.1 hypothetical protein [Mycolicibacterium sp. F2034L]
MGIRGGAGIAAAAVAAGVLSQALAPLVASAQTCPAGTYWDAAMAQCEPVTVVVNPPNPVIGPVGPAGVGGVVGPAGPGPVGPGPAGPGPIGYGPH